MSFHAVKSVFFLPLVHCQMSCSKNLKTNILKCTKKFINEMMKVLLTSLITTKYDKNEREKIITYSLIIFFGCL